MVRTSKSDMRVKARMNGGNAAKSSFELALMKQLDSAGISYDYEKLKLPYIKASHYVPDFVLREQAIIVEAKGLLDMQDRGKMVAVKKAYPDLDIRILFQNKNAKIKKGSKTTYEDWCNKYGFVSASGLIPDEWLLHKPTEQAKKALDNLLNK